jgi:hypothetical protein
MRFNSPSRRDKRLLARLMYRDVPPWLVKVPLPESLSGIYELFRVRRE